MKEKCSVCGQMHRVFNRFEMPDVNEILSYEFGSRNFEILEVDFMYLVDKKFILLKVEVPISFVDKSAGFVTDVWVKIEPKEYFSILENLSKNATYFLIQGSFFHELMMYTKLKGSGLTLRINLQGEWNPRIISTENTFLQEHLQKGCNYLWFLTYIESIYHPT